MKKIMQSSASKPCAGCFGLPEAAGMPGSYVAINPARASNSSSSVISQAFTEAKQRYGAPCLAEELPEYNIKTIAASLRRQGLRAKVTRKFSPVSYREHGLPVSKNLLKQDFYASGPNHKWSGDITYLRTDEGWLYLAVVIDLWSRAVIGWSMS